MLQCSENIILVKVLTSWVRTRLGRRRDGLSGHQSLHTLRGATFSAGSGASRPRVALAFARLPWPTAGACRYSPSTSFRQAVFRNPALGGIPFFRWRVQEI